MKSYSKPEIVSMQSTEIIRGSKVDGCILDGAQQPLASCGAYEADE
jgi:hypothetical protein